MSPAATLSNDAAVTAILAAADELFYTRGVNAVTMAELRDTAGVSMRRLYNLYPTKTDVITAWLKDRHDAWMRDFTTGVDQQIAAGEEPLTAVFGHLEQWMVATDFRGCGFINTHAAAVGYTSDQRDMVRAHKSALEQYLTGLAPNIAALAVVVDGAIVQASIHGTTAPIAAALALTKQLA